LGLRGPLAIAAGLTVMSGSCVELAPGASSAIAPLAAAHINSQLAPPRWKVRLLWNFICPDPDPVG
jgi:hypothetical protein